MLPVIDVVSRASEAPSRQLTGIEAEHVARDLALFDEIEAFAQSLPKRRRQAGLGPISDSAVSEVYEDREAQLL